MRKQSVFLVIGVLVLAVMLALYGGRALAQEPTPTPPPADGAGQAQRTITVTGSGQAFLTPDIAYVHIGVHTEGQDASQAVTDNNDQVRQVIDALRRFGIANADIQTTNFSIYPMQRYDDQGQPTGPISYSVDNTVLVTVRDLQQIGDLLDAAVQAGSNSISGIQFDVADKTQALSAARVAALGNAQATAQELAQAAGVQLGEVQSITSYSSGGQPPVVFDRMAQVGGSVPISPGQMTVTVDLTVVYAIQ
jgi:uncharacterized protein YggE